MAFATQVRTAVARHAGSRRRRLFVLCLCAPLLGLVGVVAAEFVPDGRIANHLTTAMYRGEITHEDRTPSLLGTTADHYAECTAVTVGLGDGRDGNIVRRALFSSASFGCEPAISELTWFGETGELKPLSDYMRYWHGYAVFTRPALAIVGLSGTRWLSFAILGAAISLFARSVLLRFGRLTALLAVTPGLLTTDMIVGGLAISHAIGLATAWVGGWFVLDQVGKERSWVVAVLAAALAGALNAYFDLMVAIPASLALCGVAAGLAMQRPAAQFDAKTTGRTMVAAVGGWGAGFAGMWASKWILAWLLVDHQRIIDSVRNQIEFRTGGDYAGVSGNRLTGFTKNVSMWFDQPLTPLVVLFTLGALAWVWWRRYDVDGAAPDWRRVAGGAACLAVVAVPFAGWYMALSNHNQIHYWLTYRSVAIAFGAFGAFAAVAIAYSHATPDSGIATLNANGTEEAITSEPSEERASHASGNPH